MKDVYPPCEGIDPSFLVSPEHQPDYTDVPGSDVGDFANAADFLVERHVKAGGGAAMAVIEAESGRQFTYGGLSAESSRLAGALRALGLRDGDRVIYRSPNRVEPLITTLATWKAGGVVVPSPAQARTRELREILEDTEPRVMVIDSGDPDVGAVFDAIEASSVRQVIAFGANAASLPCEQWSELVADASPSFQIPMRSADQLALIWHTGGTTGRPKACYHTHRRFLLGGDSVAGATGIRSGDRWAAAAPVGHALGFIYHTNFTLQHHATVVLIEHFADPDVVIDAIERYKIDTFTAMAAGWNRLHEALNRRPADVGSLRRGFAMWQHSQGAAVREAWSDRGVVLRNNFGSTAFATWIAVPREGEAFEPASLGRASPGFRVEALSEVDGRWCPVEDGQNGRLGVKGPTGLTYWNRPELQRRDVVDGWTLADDLIRVEPSGNLGYLGRTDFLISTSGYKVAPVEVENALCEHDSVQEACVVGTPDIERGEIVAAFVVLAVGIEPSEYLKRQLQDHVKALISPYKYPRRIEFVATLPRDHVGKLLPGVVQQWAKDGVPRA